MTEHMIIDAFLLGFIVYLQWFHTHKEKELLNRLMARDLQELSSYQSEQKRAKIQMSAHDPGLAL